MKLIEYICVFTGVCILLFFLWCSVAGPKLSTYIFKKDKLTWMNRSDVNTVDNCDLIFFSGTTLGENMFKWFGDCIFSHVGIISKENGKVYIIECDMGQQSKNGVRVILLEDKLNRYKGERIACIKKLYGEKIPIENMNIINDYLNTTFHINVIRWLFADYYISPKNEKSMFCSEFVSVILQRLKIIKNYNEKGKMPYWYSPGDYFKNKVIMHDNYFYGENIFFRF